MYQDLMQEPDTYQLDKDFDVIPIPAGLQAPTSDLRRFGTVEKPGLSALLLRPAYIAKHFWKIIRQ